MCYVNYVNPYHADLTKIERGDICGFSLSEKHQDRWGPSESQQIRNRIQRWNERFSGNKEGRRRYPNHSQHSRHWDILRERQWEIQKRRRHCKQLFYQPKAFWKRKQRTKDSSWVPDLIAHLVRRVVCVHLGFCSYWHDDLPKWDSRAVLFPCCPNRSSRSCYKGCNKAEAKQPTVEAGQRPACRACDHRRA